MQSVRITHSLFSSKASVCVPNTMLEGQAGDSKQHREVQGVQIPILRDHLTTFKADSCAHICCCEGGSSWLDTLRQLCSGVPAALSPVDTQTMACINQQ